MAVVEPVTSVIINNSNYQQVKNRNLTNLQEVELSLSYTEGATNDNDFCSFLNRNDQIKKLKIELHTSTGKVNRQKDYDLVGWKNPEQLAYLQKQQSLRELEMSIKRTDCKGKILPSWDFFALMVTPPFPNTLTSLFLKDVALFRRLGMNSFQNLLNLKTLIIHADRGVPTEVPSVHNLGKLPKSIETFKTRGLVFDTERLESLFDKRLINLKVLELIDAGSSNRFGVRGHTLHVLSKRHRQIQYVTVNPMKRLKFQKKMVGRKWYVIAGDFKVEMITGTEDAVSGPFENC